MYQLERGASGTLHFQGYIEFKASKRLTGCVKAIGGHPHVESRRGTQADAIAYCSKAESRVAGPWRFGEPSVGTGLASFVDRLRSGASLREAADGDVETYARNRSALRDFAQWLEPRGWRDVSCFYLCGATGTGKSALVYDTFGYANVYSLASQSPLWFDQYCAQSVLFIDEFAGTIARETLLRILDGHPYDAPVKGSFVCARWRVVVLCSNHDHFAGFDSALRRRFERGGFFRVVGPRGSVANEPLAELFRGALGRLGRVPADEADAGADPAGVRAGAGGQPGGAGLLVGEPVGQQQQQQQVVAGDDVFGGVPLGPLHYDGADWVVPNV